MTGLVFIVMQKKIILSVLCFLLLLQGYAQQSRPLSSTEILQKMEQLNVLGTVMYVAAHPDDENTRLLSYLVHHDHVRTVYLSLTRGDGGQNILGDEQGAALGLIRTHELMEARNIDGAEQMFTRVIDFGFTKSPEETFHFWNRGDVVSDVQFAFDLYKPDVVIMRFPTTGEGGHGQHTASAIAAVAAVNKKDAHWKPRRLLFNAFRFGNRNTTNEDQFKIAINQYDPILGEGYGEMAGRSRSVHKSQGAGTPQSVGKAMEYFQLIDGAPMSTSLYDGIDMSWNRVKRPGIGARIKSVIRHFDVQQPAASLPELLAIRRMISEVPDDFWRTQKLKELDQIIFSCAGVMAELVTDQPDAVPGTTLDFNLRLIARSATVPVVLHQLVLPASDQTDLPENLPLQNDSLYQFPLQIPIAGDEPVTEPYWLQHTPKPGAYQYDRDVYKGQPEADNPLHATIVLDIDGVQLSLPVALSYKKLDPVKGDVVQRLRIVPAVSVEPLSPLFIFERGKEVTKWVRIRAFQDISHAKLTVSNNNTPLTDLSISHLESGKDTLIAVVIPTQQIDTAEQDNQIIYSVQVNGKDYMRCRKLITYPHLPELQYFTDSRSKVTEKNWTSTVKKIGYINGAGDMVDAVLSECGLDVERIPESALSNADNLQTYDAIVMGVRAFNTQKHIGSWMPVLMQYVANGGTLVVQYNTTQDLKSKDFGPYLFQVGRQRVTEEDAVVTITHPDAVLLNLPNKITSKDFDHWVQERGVYFPENPDAHYQTMLSMHDKGEPGLNNAILYTPYGKGHYIYTSLVFFRQLPAGNRGAIRLMMNMLSVGSTGN